MVIMPKLLTAVFLLCFFFIACKKSEKVTSEEKITHGDSVGARGFRTLSTSCQVYSIIDSMPAYNTDADSTETPTILGNHRTNPYTIANMQQAYANLGLTGITVNVTNLYVRFLPNTVDQLAILDSTLDVQGLEMFDTPVDYDVIQEGDYYQDPSIPDSSITWQYAVVPPSFQFPADITYQILSQIHIPDDDYTAVETEAERLASIQDSINCSNGSARIVQPSIQECLPGYHWDNFLRRCVPNNCPDGYHWDDIEQQCEPDQLPPPPPPPAPDAQIPAGVITVSDVNYSPEQHPGVRNVRVVAKRWFKVEKTYTDNSGHFQFTKHYKHNVKIRVEFKNAYCNIRGIREARLWQSLYPVQNTIGVYGSDKNSINYNYGRFTNRIRAKGNRYWVAATTINAVQEHRDYCTGFGFSAPPMGMNIYLTTWAFTEGLASTPLFGKRFAQDFPASYVNTMLVGLAVSSTPLIGWYIGFFAEVARARLDMAIDYHTTMDRFTSDFIKETEYHECSHASQYTYAGNNWYTDFVRAELNQIEQHAQPNDPLNPYGPSTSADAPMIALGEGWAYFIGHYLADQQYAMNSSDAVEQGITYTNNWPVNSLSSHLNLLEDFDPQRTNDPFFWIPQGLFYDLMDDRNDNLVPFPRVPLNDTVSGYSIGQLFNALQSDVTTLPSYRARLLSQNGNNQAAGVNTIFTFYGY
jgi:hypothetical protein